MNNQSVVMMDCKRAWATVCRLRKSWGFGVHSPFVFGLLKDVIREERAYYAYSRLSRLPVHPSLEGVSERVGRLLFRLVNAWQPANIIEVGTGDGRAMAWLSAAKGGITRLTLDEPGACEAYVHTFVSSLTGVERRTGDVVHSLCPQALAEVGTPGIVHVAYTLYYKEVVEQVLACAGPATLIVITGLRQSSAKLAWWKELTRDDRTGIVIDLYDVGLVFCDKQRVKQLYKMTF